MRLENIFYGFTKDGKRRLLWRKYVTEYTDLGDVARTMYLDLENKEYFEPNKVDESTLAGVVRLVGDFKKKSKRKVIKAYQADCNLLYDATGTFYGNIVNKTNHDLKTEKENVLFARIADPECRVECIENGVLYPWDDRVKEGYSVKEFRPIRKDLFSKPVIKKKLLLEADYRKLL